MDHKTAYNILVRLLDKHQLDEDEQQAVLTAIGVLSWTSLAKSRMESIKAKRDKKLHK